MSADLVHPLGLAFDATGATGALSATGANLKGPDNYTGKLTSVGTDGVSRYTTRPFYSQAARVSAEDITAQLTSEFNKANASTSGYTIEMPAGSFSIFGNLPTITANGVTWRGAGNAATSLNLASATTAISVVNTLYFTMQGFYVTAYAQLAQPFISLTRANQSKIGALTTYGGFADVIVLNGGALNDLEDLNFTGGARGVVIGQSALELNTSIVNGFLKSQTSQGLAAYNISDLKIDRLETLFCAQGMLFAPGASQTVNCVAMTDSVIDTSNSNGMVIADTGGSVYDFNMTTCRFSGWNGASAPASALLINSPNLIGATFNGLRAYDLSGHVVEIVYGQDIEFISPRLSAGSQGNHGAYDGIIATGIVGLKVRGGRIGGTYPNISNWMRYGVNIQGACDYYVVDRVDTRGCITGGVYDQGTGIHKSVTAFP